MTRTMVRTLPAGFKPRLWIEKRCPHYYSIHHKEADRCDTPYFRWVGTNPWPDFMKGEPLTCGSVESWNGFREAFAYYCKRIQRALKPRKQRLVRTGGGKESK